MDLRGRARIGRRAFNHAAGRRFIVERRRLKITKRGGLIGIRHRHRASRVARHARGVPGRDIVARAARIGADFHKAVRHMHHIVQRPGRDGERRALHNRGEQRRLDPEVRRLAPIDLKQQRAQILQDARHAARRFRRDGHAAVGGHDDALGAALKRGAAGRARGHRCAHAQGLVNPRLRRAGARPRHAHHAFARRDAPSGLLGVRWARHASKCERARRDPCT